jgi:hypothetical protein
LKKEARKPGRFSGSDLDPAQRWDGEIRTPKIWLPGFLASFFNSRGLGRVFTTSLGTQVPPRAADVGPVDELEDLLNSFSDRDREWWPLEGLRPSKFERLRDRVIAAFSILYGVTGGVLFDVFGALADAEPAKSSPWIAPLFFSLLLFAFYRTTVSWAWNRRAARLQSPVPRPRSSSRLG